MKILRVLSGLLLAIAATARAEPFTFKSDNYTQNFDTKITKLWGNVKVEYLGQVFTADDVEIDNATQDLKAKGHITVNKGPLAITAETAKLNLLTGFGTFGNAILRSGAIYLEGRELSYYAEGRYRAYQGKFSTCHDCPQSWSVAGAFMDLEVEGFIEIHHALIQIRDVPVFYSPLYFLPVKTKRQSGFLVPHYIHMADLGSSVEVPYFWAISTDVDATLNYRFMKKGGHRLGTELRYDFSDRSYLRAYDSVVSNPFNPDREKERFGVSIDERFQLSPNLTQKLRAEAVRNKDPFYTIDFPGDFVGASLPALETEPSLAWQSGNAYGSASGRWYRDNLPRDQDIIRETSKQDIFPFQGEVNVWPDFTFSIPSYSLMGPLQAGADFRYAGFERRGGALDPFNSKGGEFRPIREGSRGTAQFHLTASENVWNFFLWKPSLEVRGDAYFFPSEVAQAYRSGEGGLRVYPGLGNSAYRGRILIDQSFGTEVARVWQTDLEDLKAIKHSIQPSVRWSYSPRDALSKHPFFDEPDEFPRFDLFDPNKTTEEVFGGASEEQRLYANHLITLAVDTRVIGRYGETSRQYQEFLGAGISRDYDLLYKDAEGRHRWSPLRLYAFGAYGGFVISTEMTIDTASGKANISNNALYSWSRYLVNLKQRISPDEKTFGYKFAVNNWGPWSISAETLYAVKQVGQGQEDPGWAGSDFRLAYGSPSRCWYLNAAANWDKGRERGKRWAYPIEVGFIFTESGERTSLNSMFNSTKGRTSSR